MNRFLGAFCFLCLLAPIAAGQIASGQWSGIVLLRSTKTDFEKLFGPPMRAEINLYETEGERIVIWLSAGKCKDSKTSFWNVPKDTIVGILVSPKNRMDPTVITRQIGEHFRRTEDPKATGTFNYVNEDGSIRFQTRTIENRLEDIVFMVFAPRAQDSNLRCSIRSSDKVRRAGKR